MGSIDLHRGRFRSAYHGTRGGTRRGEYVEFFGLGNQTFNHLKKQLSATAAATVRKHGSLYSTRGANEGALVFFF